MEDKPSFLQARILVVDDEPPNVELLLRALSRAGYVNLKGITDSRQVSGLLTEFQPDLILLDLLMPHVDGFGLLEMLAETVPSTSYLPVLVLTADVTAETKRKALARGAKDFLTKPFDLSEVLLRIGNMLEIRHLHLELRRQNQELEERVRERTIQLARVLETERDAAERLRALSEDLEQELAERRRAETSLRRYAERVKGLRQIDQAILRAESVEELAHAALLRLLDLVPANGARIIFVDSEAEEVIVFASTLTVNTELVPGVRVPLSVWGAMGEDLLKQLQAGKTFRLDDVAELSDPAPGFKRVLEEGSRSVVGAPMILQGDVIGVLALYSPEPKAFDEEDEQIAHEVANQLAVAVGQTRLREALSQELGERCRAQEELEKSQSLLVMGEQMARIGTWELDFRTGAVTWSDELFRLAGLEPGSVEPSLQALLSRVHPDDRPLVTEKVEEGIASGMPFHYEARTLLPDRSVRMIESENMTLLDGDDTPIKVVGTAQDITEQRKIETELRHALNALRETDAHRKSLATRLVHAQEEERRKIAGDIHDDSIQVMTAVGMQLETLRLTLRDAGQLSLLDQLQDVVSLSIARLRSLLFELHPLALDREGLAPALRNYLELFEREGGIPYRLENRLDADPPTETRVILYRIAQEAIVNIRKHARATRVDILLEGRDDGFAMKVSDDGLGFSPDEGDRLLPVHLGLAAMRERAEIAGGSFSILSAPGAGTTVTVWLPAETSQDLEG